jgi:hypothetical protein
LPVFVLSIEGLGVERIEHCLGRLWIGKCVRVLIDPEVFNLK